MCAGRLSNPTHCSPFFILINYKGEGVKKREGRYLLADLLLGMPGALDYLPEFDELLLGDLAVIVEVDGVEELVGGDLPEADLRPVFLRLAPVDRLVPVLVEDLEHVLHQVLQVLRQLLQHRQY